MSCFGTPVQYEFLDGFGESFLFVCGSDVGGRCLNFGARVPHRNAHPALLEHQNVIRHVSDRCYLPHWNVQQSRYREHDLALVSQRMGHIEVVRLRACCGNVHPAGLLNILFAFRYAAVVIADADNLGHAGEESSKRLDHRWSKLHRPLLAGDVSSIRVAHEPSGVRIYPHVQTMVLNGRNHLLRHSRG